MILLRQLICWCWSRLESTLSGLFRSKVACSQIRLQLVLYWLFVSIDYIWNMVRIFKSPFLTWRHDDRISNSFVIMMNFFVVWSFVIYDWASWLMIDILVLPWSSKRLSFKSIFFCIIVRKHCFSQIDWNVRRLLWNEIIFSSSYFSFAFLIEEIVVFDKDWVSWPKIRIYLKLCKYSLNVFDHILWQCPNADWTICWSNNKESAIGRKCEWRDIKQRA